MRSPVRPSTRAFLAAARQAPGFSAFDRLHGYIYARWPYLYIGLGTGEHHLAGPLRRVARVLGRARKAIRLATPDGPSYADTYHGKVVTLPAARQLVNVQQDITLRDLEHVIPYALARDIILRDPDHIAALECPCRAARARHCLPLDVCLIIGEPFASFVVEHHPRRARRISPGEAGAILEAEHARGHVQHAFFKDAMLGRFYAICNCCACCCGAMQAHRNGTPMLASSGYVCQVDAVLCAGCGACAEICPFGALSVTTGVSVVDVPRCMGCGVCVDGCPQGALQLVRDSARGVPLELDRLMAAAALEAV
jgi:ferredoxin